MIRPALAALLVTAGLASAAAAEPLRALPPAMVGTWGLEAPSCTNEDDDGRVEVKPRQVTFFAAFCRFDRMRTAGATIVASGRCRGEGETFVDQGDVTFRQISPTRLEITVQNATQVYQRCARTLPVR